ncbi:branched-chain amino acid transaminase [Pontibacter indicus]|uniref:Branched-chain-amino-acid aminotransferase n=1 Tax=Pontibacter indicus TaxID=1317125 RepID=A0A1R3WEX1_9BACT|nr:branched-chain amino acid transaminase [Pontibacter indicus]SIT75934.1 branched-chain amino acid aminotransferase [Pontibacter indicus]
MYYNHDTVVYLNRKMVKATEANGNLYSQTLQYGYGVFEGIRSYATEHGPSIFKAKEHYERLKKSCDLIHIQLDYSVEELVEASYKVLAQNNLQDAYLRPVVYLDPNMSLSKPTGVNLLITAWEWGAYLGDKMLNLCTSPYQRPNPKSVHVEAKVTGHYINSILATVHAKENGYDEALLLDAAGFVAEGPGANLFMEKDGKLFTPALGNILPGITRATVLEMCAELGLRCEEKQFTPEELKTADSAFYCGTAAEIIGIAQLDNYRFPLDWSESLGKKLQEHYSKLVRQPQPELVSNEQ